MATQFVLRQKVSTVNKSWLEDIYSTGSERVSIGVYNDHVEQYPDKYFELVKVETNEVCMLFTPHKD